MSNNCTVVQDSRNYIDQAFYDMTEEIKFLSSFVLANTALLMIATISIIIISHYKDVQKNRLTMQPYYWLIAYCFFFML